MRVAVDFKVMATDAALRGMGRFTQQKIFQALSTDPTLELLLVLQNPLDPSKCLYDWQAMDRVHPIWLEPSLGAKAPEARHEHERLNVILAPPAGDASPPPG